MYTTTTNNTVVNNIPTRKLLCLQPRNFIKVKNISSSSPFSLDSLLTPFLPFLARRFAHYSNNLTYIVVVVSKRKMGRGTTLGVYLKAISSSGSLLLLLLLHFQPGIITGASASFPSFETETEQRCDKVVSVEAPELLSYLGNVTFTAPIHFQGRWTTVIKFTSPFTFIGGWGVVVQSFGRKGYAIFESNEDENLKEGDQVIFQFRVLYGRYAKVPKVLSIRWETLSICGPPIVRDSSLQMTTEKPQPTKDEFQDDENTSLEDEEQEEDIHQQHISTNNVRLSNQKEFTDKNN